MALGLDDALLGWLVESAGDALARQLRVGPAEEALRRLIDEAVEASVAKVAGHLSGDQAEHLRRALLEREIAVVPARVTRPVELDAALRCWIAAFDHPEFGEPGYLTVLGVDAGQLASELTNQIASGIRRHGRVGPLNPLAEWLWREDITAEVGRIMRDLSQLRSIVEPPPLRGRGLPGGTPTFTGRQEAIAELAACVDKHDPMGSVVAIHCIEGMAGIGKTELALRVAHQHKHRYPDGQYFINLHGYTEKIPPALPEMALEELLRQAGVPGQEIPPDLAGRQARWQAVMAPRQALVVLDNALDAAQVRPLLPMSVGCLVLITSRSRPVGLPAARTLPLQVLAPAEAIELFLRLTGVDPHPDREAVARVVELVGYLPVAVEAVAGQIRHGLTALELADDLGNAKQRHGLVDEVSSPGVGARAAFETSLRRLDELHRRAFRTIGLHPGPTIGVPQFAALAGLSPAEARQLLQHLANRNLITSTGNHVGHPRYELHDLMREFARQQANSHTSAAERTTGFARLTAWYTAALELVDPWRAATETARAPDAKVDGMNLKPGEAASWLAAEQSNLLAYAELATGADEARVCHQAASHFEICDHYTAARTLFRTAAHIFREIGVKEDEAAALVRLGSVAKSTGDYSAAAEHHRAALAIYRQLRNRQMEADTLIHLSAVAQETDDYAAAGEHLHEALAICRDFNHPDGEAEALAALGGLALVTRDDAAAAGHLHAAVALYRQTGNRVREGFALQSLGRLAQAAGDHVAAGEHFNAALTVGRQTRQPILEAFALQYLARLALATGDYPPVNQYLHEALSIYRRTGRRLLEAFVLWEMGEVAKGSGRLREARELWLKVLAIYIGIGRPEVEAVKEALDELELG